MCWRWSSPGISSQSFEVGQLFRYFRSPSFKTKTSSHFRYAEDTKHNISETDFCRHLLYSSSISQKKKEKMIKMVADKFQGKSEGISFDNFKTFYNVLFGGADLERAMFFLDNKNNGVKMCLFST